MPWTVGLDVTLHQRRVPPLIGQGGCRSRERIVMVAGGVNGGGFMAGHSIGVDIGGTGIKGGRVDLESGRLAGDRVRIETPSPPRPPRSLRW